MQIRKKVLVLGAGGFIGSYLYREYNKSFDYKIIPVYSNNNSNNNLLKCDIRNYDLLKDIFFKNRPYCTINLVTCPSSACEENQKKAREINVNGIMNIADMCKRFNSRLIHLSTDMIYSGEKDTYYDLNDKPDPVSIYGKTKLEGEKIIEKTCDDYVIIRSALILGLSINSKITFVDWMLKKVFAFEKIPLFVDQIRTPIVINDIISVIYSLINSDFKGTILAAGNNRLNRVEMGKMLLASINKEFDHIKEISVDTVNKEFTLQKNLSMDNSSMKNIYKNPLTDIKIFFKEIGNKILEQKKYESKNN